MAVSCGNTGHPKLMQIPWISYIFTLVVGYVLCECDRIQIRNTRYQGVREGIYTLYNERECNGRASYVQEGSDPNYIFYVETSDGWNGWMVGSTWCLNKAGIAVQDEARHPDEVLSVWEEVYNNEWFYSESVEVVCAGLSTGAIAGIVTAVLVAILILVVVLVCCCNKKAKPMTRGPVRVMPSDVPAISYSRPIVGYNGRRPVARQQVHMFPGGMRPNYPPPPTGATQYSGHLNPMTYPPHGMPPPGYSAYGYGEYGPPPAYSETAPVHQQSAPFSVSHAPYPPPIPQQQRSPVGGANSGAVATGSARPLPPPTTPSAPMANVGDT